MKNAQDRHHVVMVGGGAGGLELATRLGDRVGHSVDLTLIDRNRTHMWKPKLHEIAAGSMDFSAHEVDYLAQAHWHRFRYRVGEMTGLDHGRRCILVASSYDADGREITPRCKVGYDTLVIAVGSQNNDFGTPGVKEYAIKLESQADARRLHARMVDACIRAHAQAAPLRPEQLMVAIIGAGATGVELAAELQRTTREEGPRAHAGQHPSADQMSNVNLYRQGPACSRHRLRSSQLRPNQIVNENFLSEQYWG